MADKQSVAYDGEKWSERYNVSKSYASDRAQATLSIPFESSSVVSIRNIEYRINESGGWTDVTSSEYALTSGTTLEADVDEIYGGEIPAGTTVEIRASGSKVVTHNGSISVLEPTQPGDSLDTKLQVDSKSSGFYIGVGGTSAGSHIHYTYNESYSGADEYARITADGKNHLHLPNAGAGSTVRVATIPVTAAPETNEVRLSVAEPKSSEPSFQVAPGSHTGDTVSYTFVDAKDDTTYLLYSTSEEIVRDSGTANSPLTLTDDNDNEETLQFLLDDDDGSSSGDGGGDSLGGAAQFARETTRGLGLGLPLVIIGSLGGLGLLFVLSRRDGPAGQVAGGSLKALTAATNAVTGRPRVAGAILGLGVLGGFATGLLRLPPGAGQLLVVSGILVGTYLVQQRVGEEGVNLPVFGAVALAATVLALQWMGANVVGQILTAIGPVIPLLGIGLLALGWQAVQAWRAPEEKTSLIVRASRRMRGKQ